MSVIKLIERNPKELSEVIIELNTKLFIKDKEIERLHSIIKEVREYIEQFVDAQKNFYPYVDLRYFDLDKVLEILDKDDNNEKD